MSSKKTYELSIIHVTSKGIQNELIKEVLLCNLVAYEDIIETNKFGESHISLFFSDQKRLRALKGKIQQLKLKDVFFKTKILFKKDWETKWKSDFKSFRLTKKILIVPAWDKKCKVPRNVNPVYIDTGVAFGTGLHPTTRFMAQLIERCEGRFTNFLDLGTGTGILTIIAANCGAQSGEALDITPEALKTAQSNLKLNKIINFKVVFSDIKLFKIKEKYDFVAANLMTEDLIQLKNKILSFVKRGQYLAVSGISVTNYKRFRDTYAKLPLKCLKIEKDEDWSAFLYKRI